MPHPDIPGAAGGKNLEGLGGWLILVGSNVVLSPFVIAARTYKSYAEMFASGVWDVLTSPDSMAYHALWAPLAIGEIILNSALILAWIYIAFLFFETESLSFLVYRDPHRHCVSHRDRRHSCSPYSSRCTNI